MTSSHKIPVCLDKIASYEPDLLRLLLHKHLDILTVPADLSGRRVLLKPNLISASAPSLACTCPVFLTAVAAVFLDRGASVCLSDSPAFGSARQVLKKHGFVKALYGLNVSLIEFKTKVVKELNCGLSVTVAGEALECDYFVNVPRVKAHQQMGVTMAMKNVFGIIIGARKAWLHMSNGDTHHGFAKIILDLQELLPPAIVIADGITIMNRKGPVNGSPLALGCVALSRNSVALDRAMLEVLGVKKERIPLAMEARKQELPGARLEDIFFPAFLPDAFVNSGFRIPQQLRPVRFQFFQYFRSSFRRFISS